MAEVAQVRITLTDAWVPRQYTKLDGPTVIEVELTAQLTVNREALVEHVRAKGHKHTAACGVNANYKIGDFSFGTSASYSLELSEQTSATNTSEHGQSQTILSRSKVSLTAAAGAGDFILYHRVLRCQGLELTTTEVSRTPVATTTVDATASLLSTTAYVSRVYYSQTEAETDIPHNVIKEIDYAQGWSSDLNRCRKGPYLYACYETTLDPSKAITSLVMPEDRPIAGGHKTVASVLPVGVRREDEAPLTPANLWLYRTDKPPRESHPLRRGCRGWTTDIYAGWKGDYCYLCWY